MNDCRRYVRQMLCGLCLSLGLGGAFAAATYGPSTYSSFADSPYQALGFSYFYLEDFSDGLNTLGARAIGIASDVSYGGLSGDANTNSFGESLPIVDFTFDALVLGALPTHVGIVWTQGGYGREGTGNIVFQAFDAANQLLATVQTLIPAQGMAAPGIFFGASDLNGIARLTIATPTFDDPEGFSVGINVDHLQYGRLGDQSVPEPSSLLLTGTLLLCLLRIRRREKPPEVSSS